MARSMHPKGEGLEGRRVLLWHWGKERAGAKFSGALARGLRDLPGTEIAILADARICRFSLSKFSKAIKPLSLEKSRPGLLCWDCPA